MVGNGGKRPKLAAVDTDGRRPDFVEQDRQADREERQWRDHIRRERSSAYWFAASKWGMAGLVAGMILGGIGMYFATIATLDVAGEAVTKGSIIERLRQEQERQEMPPIPSAP